MATLTEGGKAPEFSSTRQDGSPISNSEFQGRRFALYFYPKDDTPGCTAQACSLRDNYQPLTEAGIEVVGISADSELSHQKFISKYELPFPLIADTDHKIAEDFGVWVEKNNYGKKYMGIARTTFIIGPDGTIEHIIKKVDTGQAAAQILKLLEPR